MVKLNYTETLTFSEWEQIHNAIKEEKRTEKRYYCKQRILGGVLVAVSVLLPLLLQDITASVFLLPLGVGVMVTKDKVI
jgi:hypothetical protein